jgi:Fe-Mn family superoxide dismutase
MDMYEHAYQLDFGAAAPKYIDAFFANLRWDEVNRRYERALAAAKALRA